MKHPLRVTVLTPPLHNSGGVGTLFTYAKKFFPQTVDVTFVDTRGNFSNPIFSIFTLIRAGVWLTWAKLTSKVDLVHLNLGSRGSSIRKFSLMLLCQKILKIDYVVQIHSGQFINFYKSRNSKVQKIMLNLLNKSDQILALGLIWKESLIDIGCRPEIISEFQMGVPDLKDPMGDESEPYPPRQRKYVEILFAGKLGAHKGIPNLLESLGLPESKNMRLILLGPGDLSYWRKLASEIGVLNRVAILGNVAPELVHDYMQISDAVILPSMSEGLPVVVLESLSSNRIVISTKVGSLEDFLTNGKDVIFMDDNTPREISKGLGELNSLLLSNGANEMAFQARQVWHSLFDCLKTTEKLTKIWISAYDSSHSTGIR